MTSETTRQLREELLLNQALDKHLTTLVRRANATVAALPASTGLEENQIRNLLNVAQNNSSVEVVLSFIRYQIGRSGSVWGTNAESFGHTVIKEISSEISSMATSVRKQLTSQQVAINSDEVYIRLVRLYLGYLNRAFVFFKKSSDRSMAAQQLKGVASVE